MPSEVADAQHFTVWTMDGAPLEVVKSVQANASDDPDVIACAQEYLLKRTGAVHTWDSETKTFERVLHGAPHHLRVPVAPPRRESVAPAVRPRERRPTTRRRGRAPTNDDPSPLPDLEVRSYARFRRDVRRALGGAT
jgi:hypothetical protein